MAVLVTGGAGFIGSHLGERLLASGKELIVLDNFDPYYPRALKERNLAGLRDRSGCRFVEGDIRDAAALDRASEGAVIEAIVHLAARPGVRASVENPVLTFDINLGGTAQVLELARRRQIRRFIFASSSSVYGERNEAPFREEEPIVQPESPYAASKAAGEMLCWTYHKLFGLDVSCMRFFTVYGARQRPEMAIHRFTRLIDRGEELPVYGDGSARRDFTFVDDIVEGLLAAIERAKGYRVYNLGNSQTVEVREMIALIARAVGKPARVKNHPVQPGDVSLTCASIDRAARELDYHPRTAISTGIEKFVDWYRAESRRTGGD